MDLFRSVEPYKGGSGQLLWAINKLCNTKKHSTLVPTMITEAWGFTQGADGTPIGTLDDNWTPDEGELILMVVPQEDDAPFSGRFAFTVSVDLVDIIRDKPIVRVLEGAVELDQHLDDFRPSNLPEARLLLVTLMRTLNFCHRRAGRIGLRSPRRLLGGTKVGRGDLLRILASA